MSAHRVGKTNPLPTLERPLSERRRETVRVIFDELNSGSRNLGLMPSLYTEDVEFRDPLKLVHSRDELERYLALINRLYPFFESKVTNVEEVGGALRVDYLATVRAGIGPLQTPPYEVKASTTFWFEPGGDRVREQVDDYDLSQVARQIPGLAPVVDAFEKTASSLAPVPVALARAARLVVDTTSQILDPATYRRPKLGTTKSAPSREQTPHVGLLQNAQPFIDRRFKVVAGQIPAGLRAELLWAGPAVFERNGERLANMMDGDGSLLRLVVADGAARGSLEILDTPGHAQDERAGRFVDPRLSFMPGGPPWRNSPGLKVVNTGNTGVEIVAGGKVRALWEGGMPTWVTDDPRLDTLGQPQLPRTLPLDTVSAHYHTDPATGERFHIGGNPLRSLVGGTGIDVIRFDEAGNVAARGRVAASSMVPPHDFLMTEHHLLIIEPHASMDAASVITGSKSIVDATRYDFSRSPKLHIVRRSDLQETGVVDLPPFAGFHFTSAREGPGGTLSFVVTDTINPEVGLPAFRRMGEGSVEPHGGAIVRYDVDPARGTAERRTLVGAERSAEWPMEDPRPSSDRLYFAQQFDPERGLPGYYNGLLRTDRAEGGVRDEFRFPSGVFVNEPQVVADAEDPARAWLVAVTYDATRNASEIQVFDADRLSAGPCAILAAPSFIPVRAHSASRALGPL